MINKFLSNITNKNIYRVISIIFWASILPIIVLAFYNYPSADDFSASDTVYWAWQNTGSLIAVIRAAWENVVYNYMEWSGVYMSVFWTSMQLGIFGEKYYGLVTIITISFVVIGGFYIGHVVFDKYLKANQYVSKSIILLYLFMSIQCMPDGNEGLYWHAGVVNYTWAFAFMLIFLGLLLSIQIEKSRKRKCLKSVFACIVAVLVGGGNYLTALQGSLCGLLILGVSILSFIQKKERISMILKKDISIIIPIFTVLIAFAISIMAPGNKVRMSVSAGTSPIKAIFLSFYYCLEMLVKEWLTWPILIILAISIPLMWYIINESKYTFSYPGIVTILGFGMISSAFTPNLYAQGYIGGGRIADTIFLIWIFWLYIITFYLVGWLRKNMSSEEKEKENCISSRIRIYLVGMFAFWTLFSFLSVKIDSEIYIGSQAAYSLFSGEAKLYKEENEIRLMSLHDPKEKNIILKGFSNPPQLLSFQDVTNDESDWLNQSVAKYYGKESVRRE